MKLSYTLNSEALLNKLPVTTPSRRFVLQGAVLTNLRATLSRTESDALSVHVYRVTQSLALISLAKRGRVVLSQLTRLTGIDDGFYLADTYVSWHANVTKSVLTDITDNSVQYIHNGA